MAVRFESVVIANGAAVSSGVQLVFGERIVGVITPAEWNAADIGFDASRDGTTFFPVVDPARPAATSRARIPNVETAAALYYVVPEAMDLELAPNMRLRSINTANNTDVAQSSARTLVLAIEKKF